MNNIKKTALVLLTTITSIVSFGCSPKQNEEKAVSLEITKLPTKSEYSIGEKIDVTGGEVVATMSDGTKYTALLTDEDVDISNVNTSKAGKKSVTVTYKLKRIRFNIYVNPFTVSFDMGGIGEQVEDIYVNTISVIDELPENPEAPNYIFDGWYTNIERTNPYDEYMLISSNYTLYAKWINKSKNYYDVIFDRNYYGSAKNTTLKIEEGQKTSAIASPSRIGYKFDGWYTDPTGGELFNFDQEITESITLYSHWTLTQSGIKEYIFEAENIDLEDKLGHGYSGERMGSDMAMEDILGTASGGYFLGYTYTKGMTFDFKFASDRDAENVKIVASLSGEFADFTLTPNMFAIYLNGEAIDYGSIAITDVPGGGVNKEFADYLITTNAKLKKGANILTMAVENEVNWIGGGTVEATAPLIDCIKVTSDAVLWWDGTFGYPVKNVY